MELSTTIVKSLVESEDQFPIDFEDAWRWIGYSTKQAARKKLINNFDKDIDYLSKWMNVAHTGRSGGSSVEKIMLTTDCFKSLSMMAGTEKGREVRKYFLRCEEDLKKASSVIQQQSEEMEKLRLQLELAKTQERLAVGINTLEAIAPGLGQLALGRADVVVERVVEVDHHVITDTRGRVVYEHSGQSPTTVAKSLGMRTPKELRAFLESVNRLDLLEDAKTIIDTQRIRTEHIAEIRRIWSQRNGNRQRILGEQG